jgi:uncharacterized protein (UPF0147 family)
VDAEQVVRRLKALRDPQMRVRVLVEGLRDGDASEWVEALDDILSRARSEAQPDFLEALECLTHAAADPTMPYETRQRVYAAAVARERGAIARLFLAASPPVDIPPNLRRQLGPERPLRPTDRPLTLGERKALARTHRRDQLLLLLRDPHPDVVAILLDNPHVTEADIVRVASARPAVPAALALVAAHVRWSVRHPVKRALVLNPATPLADAIRLATTLRAADLEELASDPSLPEPLRDHARELVTDRSLS